MTDKPLLDILHVDSSFVVVNKESGMLAVPGRGPEKIDSVSHRVKLMFPGCIEQPSVHRLDMDTSGLMVVARTTEAHRNLSRQFHERETQKRYIAVLDGLLEKESGTIELPFRLDVDNRPIQIYDEVHGKVGVTYWRKLKVERGRTRVEFIPVTGRT
ncbi:MAG: RluA family pseudouridine synthase, partial [Akkermansiaceae bacterium]